MTFNFIDVTREEKNNTKRFACNVFFSYVKPLTCVPDYLHTKTQKSHMRFFCPLKHQKKNINYPLRDIIYIQYVDVLTKKQAK